MCNKLTATQNELSSTRDYLIAAKSSSRLGLKPKKTKSFTGQGSIQIWITYAFNYIGNDRNPQPFSVPIIYISGSIHERWIGYNETDKGRQVTTWPLVKEALIRLLESLNREKVARGKLDKWKQFKDVG